MSDVGDAGGLVRLAAVGDGGEEGRVGLNEEAIERDDGGGLADLGCGGIGEIAGEGDIEVELEGAPGLGGGAGEAMHDAREAGGGPVIGEEIEEVDPGVGGAKAGFGGGGGEVGGAAVKDDGFAGGGGELQLGEEGTFLHVWVGVLDVVVVEADLADGDRERVGEETGEFFEGLGGGMGGLVGVDAGGGEQAGLAGVGEQGAGARELEGTLHGVGPVADADGEDGGHAGGLRAGEDVGTLGVVVEVEMGVGVGEHGSW